MNIGVLRLLKRCWGVSVSWKIVKIYINKESFLIYLMICIKRRFNRISNITYDSLTQCIHLHVISWVFEYMWYLITVYNCDIIRVYTYKNYELTVRKFETYLINLSLLTCQLQKQAVTRFEIHFIFWLAAQTVYISPIDRCAAHTS